MMRPLRLAAACVLGLTALGCSDPIGFACTAEFRYGLSITVLDGSGAPAAEGALGLAVDGSYVDTLEVFGSDTMVGAGERPGTYDITVSKDGYMTWSAQNVTVTADECHVRPVTLEANLIPIV